MLTFISLQRFFYFQPFQYQVLSGQLLLLFVISVAHLKLLCPFLTPLELRLPLLHFLLLLIVFWLFLLLALLVLLFQFLILLSIKLLPEQHLLTTQPLKMQLMHLPPPVSLLILPILILPLDSWAILDQSLLKLVISL